MDLDFEDYKQAFEDADQPFTLNQIVDSPEDFPDTLRKALASVDQEAVVAFYFEVYVEEVDNTMNSWLPIKKTELLTDMTPERFASQLSPVLKSAYTRMLSAEKQKEVRNDNGTPNAN